MWQRQVQLTLLPNSPMILVQYLIGLKVIDKKIIRPEELEKESRAFKFWLSR